MGIITKGSKLVSFYQTITPLTGISVPVKVNDNIAVYFIGVLTGTNSSQLIGLLKDGVGVKSLSVKQASSTDSIPFCVSFSEKITVTGNTSYAASWSGFGSLNNAYIIVYQHR